MHRHLLAGTIEGSVFVIAVLARQRRVRNHVVRQVPLPEVSRRVAAVLKQPRQQRSLRTQPVRHVAFRVARHPREVTINVVPSREMSRHHGRSTGRADSAGNRESMEVGALFRQPINVRRLHIRMPVTTEVTPAPVIRKDENNVRLRCG